MDRLGDSIRREAGRLGLPAASSLVSRWPEIVGEIIAANAWPARASRDGTLHVSTSSASWAFELTHLAPEILVRLRETLGDDAPPKLRFAPGNLPARGQEAEPEETRHGPEVGAELKQAADDLASCIDDDELRELVARAAALSLAASGAKTPFRHTPDRPF